VVSSIAMLTSSQGREGRRNDRSMPMAGQVAGAPTHGTGAANEGGAVRPRRARYRQGRVGARGAAEGLVRV